MKTNDISKEPEPKPKKLTKAERRAQQAEFNRQLWQEAYERLPIVEYR